MQATARRTWILSLLVLVLLLGGSASVVTQGDRESATEPPAAPVILVTPVPAQEPKTPQLGDQLDDLCATSLPIQGLNGDVDHLMNEASPKLGLTAPSLEQVCEEILSLLRCPEDAECRNLLEFLLETLQQIVDLAERAVDRVHDVAVEQVEHVTDVVEETVPDVPASDVPVAVPAVEEVVVEADAVVEEVSVDVTTTQPVEPDETAETEPIAPAEQDLELPDLSTPEPSLVSE